MGDRVRWLGARAWRIAVKLRAPRPPMLSFVAVLPIALALVGWQASVQVNDVSAGQQDRPDIAIGADSAAYLIWDDYRSGTNFDIYFSLRDPLTGTWSANERVSDDTTGRTQWNAAIAIDGSGVAYAVWQDQRDGKRTPDTNIYFAKRGAGGWSANVRVNDDTRAAALQSTPRIAVTSGGTAYAVWEDDRAGNSDVWFAKLAPGASGWTANERISDDPGTAAQYGPRIDIAANGDLFVVWLDDRVPSTEVRMARLRAGSASWEASRVVSDALAVPVSLAAGVAGDGSAFAVWQ